MRFSIALETLYSDLSIETGMRRSLLIRWKCKLGDEIEILIEIIFGYVAFERGWFERRG